MFFTVAVLMEQATLPQYYFEVVLVEKSTDKFLSVGARQHHFSDGKKRFSFFVPSKLSFRIKSTCRSPTHDAKGRNEPKGVRAEGELWHEIFHAEESSFDNRSNLPPLPSHNIKTQQTNKKQSKKQHKQQ